MSDKGVGTLWINLEQLAATPPETVAQTRRLLDELEDDPPPNVSVPRWQAMLAEARQVLTMIEHRPDRARSAAADVAAGTVTF